MHLILGMFEIKILNSQQEVEQKKKAFNNSYWNKNACDFLTIDQKQENASCDIEKKLSF